MSKAIGMVEYKTTSAGVVAADSMVKTSEVSIIEAQTVCPGKYIVIITGDLSAVTSAVDNAKTMHGKHLINSFVLGNPHESIFPAIYGAAEIKDVSALGIIESYDASSIIVEEARRRGVPVTMLTDTSHVLREDYAAVVTVEKGRDSVDFKLVTLCGAGDVVVTQDYGVAAMALGRGARCLNQNGLLYTNGNIEQLLYTRHENGKARRRGHYTPVPKRTPADDEAFRRALSAMLDEGKKNE